MKIQSLFIHPHVIPNLYAVIQMEHKRRISESEYNNSALWLCLSSSKKWQKNTQKALQKR